MTIYSINPQKNAKEIFMTNLKIVAHCNKYIGIHAKLLSTINMYIHAYGLVHMHGVKVLTVLDLSSCSSTGQVWFVGYTKLLNRL